MLNDREIVLAATEGSEQYRKEQLDFLETLCNIDSNSGNVKGNEKVVAQITAIFDKMNVPYSLVYGEGYGNHIVAKINEGNPNGKVILHAHTDTAFHDGDVKGHEFHYDGEFAYGLGTADCKGGVTTVLYGLRIAVEKGMLPDKEITVIFNCDEEVGSPTGHKVFEKESKNADAVISFEPGRRQNGILTSRYGLVAAYVSIEGKAAHATGDNGYGANAVLELANLIMKMNAKEDEEKGIHYNVSPIKGGSGINMVPDHAEAGIWGTCKTKAAYDEVRDFLFNRLEKEGIVEGCKITVKPDLCFPAMERTPETIAFYEKLKETGALLGMALPEETSRAAGDCNYFAGFGVPTVDGLGPYLYEIHTLNEHTRTATLAERTKLAAAIIARL